MKRVPFLAAVAAAGILVGSAQASGRASQGIDHPEKIGLGTWDKDAKGTSLKDVGRAGFAWHYNWSERPLWNSGGTRGNPYVPMIWDRKGVTPERLAQAKASGASALLGFNEPDERKQSNMTVEQAIALWPQLEATGMRLGSPATTRQGSLGPDSWLGRFMAEADGKGLRVDFIAVHYYSTDKDVDAFREWLEALHRQYDRPIWVTEWALADWNDPSRFSAAEQAEFARAGTEMMDDLPFVERHAWFAAYEGGDGWNLNSGIFDAKGDLSPVGKVFSEFSLKARVTGVRYPGDVVRASTASTDDMVGFFDSRIMAAKESAMSTRLAEKTIEAAYERYRAYEGGNRFEAPGLTGKEIAATLLGNFNYQIENGGISQWWDNRYAFEKGPNGTSTHVAIAALATRFREVDPEVADHVVEAMTFVDRIPELERKDREESRNYTSWDDEDEDEPYEATTHLGEHLECETISDRYCAFEQDRRIAFIGAVVKAFPKDGNPFDATFEFAPSGPAYTPPSGVKHPNVHVRLAGEDGNAYSIISRTREAMRKARLPQSEIDAYVAEAESGDYDKVIQTTMRWVNYDPPEPEQGSSFRM